MKRFNFHVLLIPLNFIFYLYLQNVNKVAIQNILVSIIAVSLFAGLIWVILFGISRSRDKAAILTSIFIILFLNFGSINRLTEVFFEDMNFDPVLSAKIPLYSLVLLSTFFVLISLIIMLNKKEPRTLNRLANYFSIAMVGITLGFVLLPVIQKITNTNNTAEMSFSQKWQGTLRAEPDLLKSTQQPPDIYYIILDGYGRSDVLDQLYGFDNRSFLDSLANLNFQVATGSLTNYKATTLSLASSLNMDYVNWINSTTGNAFDYLPLFNLTEHNRVFNQIHRLGYRVSTFATGFASTEIESADHVFRPAMYPNEFEMLVINTTPFGFLWNNQLHSIHRDRVQYTLTNIAEAGTQPGPDFVFAHVFSPHPPFVFGANGEFITPDRPYSYNDAENFLEMGSLEEYKTGYINQLAYLNKLVLSAIQEILQNSNTPPIIIIQGDHGPGSQLDSEVLENSNLAERYPILNAYYIPCDTDETLPDDITPVNSFRYVFNACFQAEIPYLENRQYFSPNSEPFNMTDVTGQIRTGQK